MILGIDLSTVRQSSQGKTQVAICENDENGLILHELIVVDGDEALLSLLKEPFLMCGIDAPLSLPPCVLCRELPCDCPFVAWMEILDRPAQTSYHYRLSDLIVRETIAGVSPKPPLSNGGPVDITPLTMRWMRLARILVTSGFPLHQIVEVYATGAIQLYARAFGLTDTKVFYYRSSIKRRALFLEKMRDSGRLIAPSLLWDQMERSDDSLDAVMAGLSAWHALHRSVLLPDTLLGLDPKPAFGVVPLSQIERTERQNMANWLLRSPWVMLPDLSSFWENLQVNLDSEL